MYSLGSTTSTRGGQQHSLELAEFQVVILAGPGASLQPLTTGTPKALLPLAGKPMLHYALQWVEASGIKDILVVAAQSGADLVNAYVRTLDAARRPEVAAVDDKLGSAEALRRVRDKLRSHVVVMSVDSVPTDPLAVLLDQFRIHDAAAIGLYFASDAPDHLVGLAPLDTATTAASAGITTTTAKSAVQRLVQSTPLAALAKSSAGLPVRMDLMRAFPSVRMQKLLDGHVYVLRRWVLDVLLQDATAADDKVAAAVSLQRDALALLTKAQYAVSARALFAEPESDGSSKGDGLDVAADDAAASTLAEDHDMALVGLAPPKTRRQTPLVLAYVSSRAGSGDAGADGAVASAGGATGASTPAALLGSTDALSGAVASLSLHHHAGAPLYQQLAQLGYSGLRAQSAASYAEVNRGLARVVPDRIASTANISARSQVGPDSTVGDSTTMGDRCSVKKSVVGAHCTIGRGVKLVNCVIMDHAVVEDNAKLEGTIVCAHGKVGEKCDLRDSVVAARVAVPRETVARNERYV
ncbi:Translation initiation factor eIF-2B subunit gamma [Blastocladiella emersonii ATCC 22665]|nr:Translation initiation factor eIF-2B subunit gamma [Blastocladiella emersonii ATCC 22665]